MVQDQSCDTPKWGHVYLASSPPGRKKWVYRLLPAEQESYDKSRWHIKKQRHHFANKRPSSQSYGFSSIMYGCESWAINEAEHRRIDAFELVVLEKTVVLRIPWTARRSSLSQRISVLNIHWKDWWWSWNSNTLATWCKKLIHLKRPWCWERLKAGGKGDDWVWDGWMASPTQWTRVWVNSGSWWWTGRPGVLRFTGLQHQTRLSDWTELNWIS